MTVNLVIVSHSASLAEGTAELARQMGGDDVLVEPAGGMDDGSIGTDAERVRAAIERVRSSDGVLVLMDLGSALLSAEIAMERHEDGGPVALSAAPLVEGAVAAAATAVRLRHRGGIARRIVGVSRWLEWLATKITGLLGSAANNSRPDTRRRT